MTKYSIAILLMNIFGCLTCFSQVAPDCINATPICKNTPVNAGTNGYGVDDFNGASVSGCIEASVTIETNSAWYRFRVGKSGQLGFNIGYDSNEDWDFALYKTNDCDDLGEPVRCDFFDNSDGSSYIGIGEDPTGADNIQYKDWLEVTANEDYYLLINNYSNNNSGFSIQFSGNIFIEFPNTALDCDIIDNLLGPPISACDTETVILDATTFAALKYEWYLDIGTGYQRIPNENEPQLSVAVSGMYRVLVLRPSGNNLISETQVAYVPSPVTYPVSDETVCFDGTAINLRQKDAEALENQSPFEFSVTYHASLEEAINSRNALPKEYIPTMPSETIYVRTTSIENGTCFDASESFEINSVELPTLDFDTNIFMCGESPVVTIGEELSDSNFTYEWSSGETTSSITVAKEGVYTLSVSNKQGALKCITIRSVAVIFSTPPVITDIRIAYEDDLSNVVKVFLEEQGNFEYQLDDEIPQNSSIFNDLFPGEHTITVNDLDGCAADFVEIVVIGFPKFFTPNADGVNDKWQVSGLLVLDNPIVRIYDRYGKFLHQLNKSSTGWDGSFKGTLLPESDYWFKLSYTNSQGQSMNAAYVNNHFTLKR
ncbi:T9SS type B sorting domain-containing protein [Maribacter sp. ACAM166]|uniref:T9SS type B sorting domain-containing protein n=1 Tax=Maribacter sp. ACAM166 TaxID=2508996 RepID=UPI0010FD1041|nr:T9SS type B sorting domain-containing protein [Maribacter sp. ACAM166]TLP77036.1 T9SS type B sorting domain-containing protein [Maribacter sp. ACAM166]